MAETIRQAFVLKFKPGALAEYVDWHHKLWPELRQEIERQGITEITLFHNPHDDTVLLFSRVTDSAAWSRLWDSPIHRRWAEIMEPLMHYRDDGIVESREVAEIWHLTTAAGA